jgi:hypothetical protein
VMKCGKEKGKVKLGDEVWQRERKRKIGWWSVATRKERGEYAMKILHQFYILWFDWTVTRTHNLPHSQLERLILHHRCGYDGHIENRLHVTKHIVLYIAVTVAKYIELNGIIG